MKKKLVFLVLLISIAGSISAQNGTIKGSIKTSDRRPAEFVSVGLKGKNKGTTTNSRGEFELKNIEPGQHLIMTSLVGLITQEISVTVKAGETITLPNIILNEDAKQLSEVVVSAQGNKPVTNKESDQVARMPLKNIENPQVYTVINSELIKEKNVTDIVSALNSLPGVSGGSMSAYGFSQVFMRGFIVTSFIRNGLYAPALSGGDPQVVERFEAIKGPSGTLFGSSNVLGASYGGLVNKVTKKPFEGFLGEAGLSFGSYDQHRVTADINTPLNEGKTVLFRVNTAYNAQGTFLDVGAQHSFLFAPSLTYIMSDRLSVNLDVEINSLKYPTPFYLYQIGSEVTATSRDQMNLDYFKSYSSNDLTHPATLQNFYAAQLNYRLSGNWQLNTHITLTDANSLSGSMLGDVINDSSMTRSIYDWDYEWHTADVQANLNGSFHIGKVKNKILVGIDYQHLTQTFVGGLSYNVDTVNLNRPAVPVLNVNEIRSNYGYIFSGSLITDDYAAYFSDVINLTDRFNLMLSLRYDHLEFGGRKDLYSGLTTTAKYSKDALTPKLGATYQLIKEKLSVFGNYMQGFNYVAPNAMGQSFDPEFATQTEGGVKFDITKKISTTLSYYDIGVKNKIRPDPYNPLLQLQNGTQQSTGLDFDISVSDRGFNLIGGYSYNESKFKQADISTQNKRPLGVPYNAANLWMSYALQKSGVKGLGAGFGINYNGQVYFNNTNTLSIPDYTIFKASLFYNQPKYRLSLTADNLADVHYYNNTGLAQTPWRILASISMKF